MTINEKEMECIRIMYYFCVGEGCEPCCSFALMEKIGRKRK